MAKTILKILEEHSKNIPDRKALITEKETLTYSEFWNEIKRCSVYLADNGIKRGSMVIIKAAQSPSYLICYYAVQLAGAVVCCLEQNTPSSTVLSTAEKIDSKVIISEKSMMHNLTEDMHYYSMKSLRKNAEAYPVPDDAAVVFPSENDTQLIMFTTGTTGASKGVELSFMSMGASEEKIAHFLNMKDYAENGLFVTPTPLNHAKGIWETGGMLRTGGSIYILRGMVDLNAYFKALDYPCEKLLLSLVPANLRILTTMVPDELHVRADKIKAIKLGTAPLLEHDKETAMKLLPNTDLHNPYGSSEAGILTNYKFNEYPGLEFCIGKALINTEVLVVDENRVPINSSKSNMGKLAFRSNSVMKGYYNEPELTASILEDGIVYTNDFGYVDENGFIYVRGRADDVINVGGFKVSPEEVESAAIRIEGIKDCICISRKDELYGDVIKLLVVMKEKGTMDVSKIRKALSHSLETYKMPKQYEEVDEVARMYNGKINRKAYRQ